jgi:hypothetical protein
MEPDQHPSLTAQAFTIVVLTVRTQATQPLTVRLTPETLRRLAVRTRRLFLPTAPTIEFAVAVGGQAYTAEQLAADTLAETFAEWTRTTVAQELRDQSLPLVLPISGHALRTTLPATLPPPPVAAANDEPPYFQAIGFPAALLGSASALATLLPPRPDRAFTPVDRDHPAIVPLEACISAAVGLPAEDVFLIAPLQTAAIAEWVTDMSAQFRREWALEHARSLATSVECPVAATVAAYGQDGAMSHWSVVIQDVATLDVVATYRYRADDFSDGVEALQYVNDLAFAWGIQQVVSVPVLLPVVLDATGALIVYRQTPEHNQLAALLTHPERGH